MSAKIVQAVNAMIANADRIADVTPASGGEILFRYDGKYVWGISMRDGSIYLYYYPGNPSIPQLAPVVNDPLSGFPSVVYSTDDIGTREGRDSFAALHLLVTEKVHGVDKVLDDIIDDDVPF